MADPLLRTDGRERPTPQRTAPELKPDLLSLAVEQSTEGIAIVDLAGQVLFVNRAFAEMHGYKPAELLGRHLSVFHTPAQMPAVEEANRRILATGSFHGDVEHVRRDGTVFLTQMHNSLVYGQHGEPTAMIGTLRDLTAVRRTETALQESRALLRQVIDLIPHIIFVKDLEGRFLLVNRAAADSLNLTVGELTGRKQEEVHPDPVQAKRMLATDRQVIETQRPLLTPEEEYRDASGRTRIIQTIKVPFFTADSTRPAVLGVAVDITELKQAEHALQQAEETWRSLTENSPDFILLLDTEGVIRFINHSPHQPKEQVIGSSIYDLTLEESKPVVRELIEGVRRTGRPDCREARYQNPGGDPLLFELRVGPIFKADKVVALVLSGTDVTERRQLQAELAKLQQLEALGVLAGGVAHDFNNILTAIMANLSLVRMSGDTGRGSLGILAEAEEAVLRARGLTQQLLAFAKGGAPLRKPTNVAGLIRETTTFCLSGSNVRCEYSLPENLWAADIDKSQIGQVIQNLVINADQAMPEGGILRVRAENVSLGEGEHTKLKAGRYVRIAVEDQGSGIPEGLIPKIFDPFFTTKERGRGLGLSVTFSVVNRHDGAIQVDSRVGVGSTFRIYLPASGSSLPDAEPDSPREIKGEGRILLVDDEEIILKAAGKVLKRLGYRVECSLDGVEAIERYRLAGEAGRPFDVVIMDLTIPGGVGGREAVRRLREIDPGARVIVSSGYSDDTVMSRYREFGFSGVLLKPFTLQDLSEVLESVLRE